MNINSSILKIMGTLLRAIPIAIYASWIFVGYRVLLENQLFRPAQFRYVATGNLPTNHMLRQEDILADASLPLPARVWLPKTSEFEGKYVAKMIYRGQNVELSNLRSNPAIIPSPGNIAYVFSLQHQSSLANVLNADATVGICAVKCNGDKVRVLTLLCASSKKDECSVVLDLSPTQTVLFSDPVKVQLVLK